MVNSLVCPCGKSLRVSDDLAGKRVKCPNCGGVQTVLPADDVPVEMRPKVNRDSETKSGDQQPRKRKPKIKKEDQLTRREQMDLEYKAWLRRKSMLKRVFRSIAFIVLGLIIIAGASYLLLVHRRDIEPLSSMGMFAAGLIAVLKGVFDLLFSRLPGETQ